jgi:RHS repeat-associated protein
VVLVETKTVDVDAVGVFTPVPRTRFQLDNHLGSASLEVDESGLVIGYEEYHPYGTTAYASGRSGAEVSGKRYRYTGKERDEETGFYYNGARHYAAWLARWGSCDPSGLVDGPNLYTYARNRPSLLNDPSGREAQPSIVFTPNPNSVLVDYVPATPSATQQPIEITVHGPPRAKKAPRSPATNAHSSAPPPAATTPTEAVATPAEAVGAFSKGAAKGLATGMLAEFAIGVGAGIAGVTVGTAATAVGVVLLPFAIYGIVSHWDEITSGVDRLVHNKGTAKDFEAAGEVVGGILSMRAAGPAGELGAEVGQGARAAADNAVATFGAKLAPAGAGVDNAAAVPALQSRGSGTKSVAGAKTVRPLTAADMGVVEGADVKGTFAVRDGKATAYIEYLGKPENGSLAAGMLGARKTLKIAAREAGARTLRIESTRVIELTGRLLKIMEKAGFQARPDGTMWWEGSL